MLIQRILAEKKHLFPWAIILCLAIIVLPFIMNHGYWNHHGDFELTPMDTHNIVGTCKVDAPWGNDSWGIEAGSFLNTSDYALSAARFISNGHNVYLYGKEDQHQWGFVRYVQGSVWNGTNCHKQIPWYRPEPVAVNGKQIQLMITVNRDTSVIQANGWVMLAVNLWFSSPDLPVGTDINGRKPLVMDLAFYHDCNYDNCRLENHESDQALHYQALIGTTPEKQSQAWTIDIQKHIEAALQYHWQRSGSIAAASKSLKLYQIEFVIELHNAVGAATIDNFYLDIR